jgi:acyl-CoA thioesterase-1
MHAVAGDLPRVLIIGDSISGGYANTVVAELKGVAVVVKCPGNAGPTATALAKPVGTKPTKNAATNAAGEVPDPAAFETNIDYYLAHGPFDVIHFNWGLHDLKRGGIPVDQYIGNLDKLVGRMQEQAPKAKLIFATTTPVPPSNNEGRVPEKVVEFNAAAVKWMKGKGVDVNDLYVAVVPRLADVQLKDNVHFGAEGYQLLGKQVAASIAACLAGRSSEGPQAPAPASQKANPASTAAPNTENRLSDAAVAESGKSGTSSAATDLAKLVKFTVEPPMDYKLDYLKVGAIQHCDRPYVYRAIPEQMIGAVVFQGVHRAPLGTGVKIEVLAPTTVYCLFYHGAKYSGGYDKIFPKLEGWQALNEDVHYGHGASAGKEGKIMKVYRRDAQDGVVEIPATSSENGVFALAVKAME